jgi:hypothetical protein
LLCNLFAFWNATGAQNKPGAGFREGQGGDGTHAGRGASDQHRFALKIEKVTHGGSLKKSASEVKMASRPRSVNGKEATLEFPCKEQS